jgi:hypothetical protein
VISSRASPTPQNANVKPINLVGKAYHDGHEYNGIFTLTSDAIEFRAANNYRFTASWTAITQVGQDEDDRVTIFAIENGVAVTHEIVMTEPAQSLLISAFHNFVFLNKRPPTESDMGAIRAGVDEAVMLVRRHQAVPKPHLTAFVRIKRAVVGLLDRLTVRG